MTHPALAPGKVAVVTGGASGIGLAAAARFASLGMKVCIADRVGLDEAKATLGDVLAVETDVSDRAAVAALAEQVAATLGPVAVLMNNAGVGGGGDALTNSEGWERVLGVNLMGPIHGVQAFVPAMVESGAPGIVINTGSKQGITQPPGDTAYNVSKSGVKALTEGLAHTLRQAGGAVSAHLLIPGFTFTGMTRRRVAEQPPGAWSAEQVVDRMIAGIGSGEFYILCQDNETTRAQDERRILWAAGDIVENRPALSRWHPDWKDAFAAYMDGA
ncbi:SDR family NAD(P)-dependent oxidoreductase [Sphingomonas immobilis]|uniref:SDR family NAD(P)-dependent oxidoreductase n=1 Tax=Sphingomonas immobilis TaxID=3063997 RepID=A0ABT8ZX79_9SPHN|nr:SDR family NAD(P)-dependent oxidoreductase [Sphingomonas sp. CA1-15]MDO7842156.1 SDR family NAD(P)-dependent oxidoreductase [Sphingomonas sp. CA1-15]